MIESSSLDPKAIWREQDAATASIPVAAIRARAERTERLIQRQTWAFLVGGLVSLALLTSYAWEHRSALSACGLGLLAFAYAGGYARLRGLQSRRPSSELTVFAFHLRQLYALRDARREMWRWTFGPMLLGLGLFMIDKSRTSDHAPLWVTTPVLAIVLGLALALERRQDRRLQRCIAKAEATMASNDA